MRSFQQAVWVFSLMALAPAYAVAQSYAYVADSGDNTVSGYSVNAATGALTPVPGSPFAAGLSPYSVTVDPTGKFVYVANYFDGTVSAYTINATTGALTSVPGSPFAAEFGTTSVTVDPMDKFVYVANNPDNTVSAFTINATSGALTPVPGSPFAGGSGPFSVAITPKATPAIGTTAPVTAAVGSSIADQATVTGGLNPSGTVTFNLYNNSTATGPALFSDTEPLSGGTATSAGYLATATGTVYWVATYNGDYHDLPVTSATAAESVTITPATPAINTMPQPASATIGSSIADQATITGGYNPTGTVTFKLYNNSTASGTPLFTDASEPLVAGVATSKGYATTALGTVYWVATYNGNSNNYAVSSGAAAESVVVGEPTSLSINNTFAPVMPSSQTLVLTATVTSIYGTVNGGTVTFTVLNSANVQVGAAAVSGPVTNGMASANYTLPAGTPVGIYDIAGIYSGTAGFAGSSEDPPTLTVYDTSFQLHYAANLNSADSLIDVVNTGYNGASANGPGFGAAIGNLCINAYAFSPDEELLACCSCLITPGATASLSVKNDLISIANTAEMPASMTVALVATLAGTGGTGSSCTNSAALATSTSFPLAPSGMQAWDTGVHLTATSVLATTESPFLPATLSPSAMASMAGRCAATYGNSGGTGICNSCKNAAPSGAK